MSLRDKVQKKGLALGFKVAEKVMQSPSGINNVAKAAEVFNKVRGKVDSHAEKVLHFSQLPSKEDMQLLTRQAGRLKRQSRKIESLLEELEGFIK